MQFLKLKNRWGKRCIGLNNLPKFMLDSHSYSGNELGAFANSTGVPDV